MNVASVFFSPCALARRLRAALGVAVGLVALFAVPALADEDCEVFRGDFTSAVVPNPPPGAVLATHGVLTGDLHASYDFVMTSLHPDPNDPTTLYYAGYSVITLTRNGHQLFTNDTGIMHLRQDGTAPFTTTANIVGGTRNFQHASGRFVAPGVLDLTTGRAVGTYTATICNDD